MCILHGGVCDPGFHALCIPLFHNTAKFRPPLTHQVS